MTQAPVPWISKLHIENFKSIEFADLDLGPLTVLVGANSAGKSSVLQTLVLLSQIVRGRSQSSLVNLNGVELQLGTFADIKHAGERKGAISFSIVVNVIDDLRTSRHYIPGRSTSDSGGVRETVSWELVLGSPDSTQIGSAKVRSVEVKSERSEAPAGAILTPTTNRKRCEALEAAATRRERLVRLRREFDVPVYGGTRSLDTSKFYDVKPSGQIQLRGRPMDIFTHMPATGPKFSSLDNGLPNGLFAIMPDSEVLAETWLLSIEAPLRRSRKLSALERSREMDSPRSGRTEADYLDEILTLLFPSFRLWVDAFDADEATRPQLPEKDLERFTELFSNSYPVAPLERKIVQALATRLEEDRPPLDTLAFTRTKLDDLASDLRERMWFALWYLGPLREDPSPAYRPGQGGGIARLGLKGEYTVPELERFGSTDIEVILPPDDHDGDGDDEPFRVLEAPLTKTTLKEAVDEWMTYLRVASAVEVRETGRAGIELGIVDQQTATERNLTNVGVGVSQLLPVVVMCLQAERGDVVLIEQPELHLHPAPQQALGDFLLAMSVSGRQLIIETHSEYLINRLRLRIAEDDTESVSSLIKIIYAERRNGKTEFREITPNTYGSFDDWPDDFFDQAPKETEKILRAAMAKRKRRRAQANTSGSQTEDATA